MEVYNSGTLCLKGQFDIDLQQRVDERINALVGKAEIKERKIIFTDIPGVSIRKELDDLLIFLRNHGIEAEGRIYYYGDYDGAYLISKGEKVRNLSLDQLAIRDASDQELIEELQNRGYSIMKE